MPAFVRLFALLACVLAAPAALSQQEAAAQTSVPERVSSYQGLLERVREVLKSPLSAEQKQRVIEELLADYPQLLELERDGGPASRRTPDEVEAHLELLIIREAALLAPTPESEARVLNRLERDQPPEPPLIAPLGQRGEVVVNPVPQAEETLEPVEMDSEHREVPKTRESAKSPAVEEKPPLKKAVKVRVLADDQVTEEMHDDTTVLSQVEDRAGDQQMSEKRHLWAGGALQYDAHWTDGVFGLKDGGDGETDTSTRRAEAIVRAGLFEQGEVKLQYDLDGELWRDLYWRWVAREMHTIITVGNQKEPLGMDYLMGNKFDSPMERSAPSNAFGSFRGQGVRLNRWWNLEGHHPLMNLGKARQSAITATVGVFTEGLDSSKDTDLALTGRLTYGWQRSEETGFHMAVAATARDGEFSQIATRPEWHSSDQVTLASLEADRQYALAFEGMYVHGPLYGRAELYLSDYRGGDVGGEGLGAYVQAGWMITGEEREYRPRWGLLAPVRPKSRHAFELFGRLSYTWADGDEQAWNSLGIATLGGNWYYRKFRGSLNLLLGGTRNDVQGEDAGVALTARIQYLF